MADSLTVPYDKNNNIAADPTTPSDATQVHELDQYIRRNAEAINWTYAELSGAESWYTLAKEEAEKAATSAEASAVSEAQAAISAGNASASATSASTSAAAAAVSEANAASSAQYAENQAVEAEGYKDEAAVTLGFTAIERRLVQDMYQAIITEGQIPNGNPWYQEMLFSNTAFNLTGPTEDYGALPTGFRTESMQAIRMDLAKDSGAYDLGLITDALAAL
jgi:hypothetical protein